MAIMHQKLKVLQVHLRNWNKNTFGDIFKDKAVIQENLETLQCQAMENGFTPDTKLQERELLHQFNKICDQ